jgi:four helix bundle protein
LLLTTYDYRLTTINMNNYKELKVWQKALEFTTVVYVLTKSFPKEEQFGLINQLRRAASSIPSNIAEGAGRNSEKEFNHFLSIALGSSFEIETQLIIAKNVEILTDNQLITVIEQLTEIQKMLRGLQKTLNMK